jgi:hypothetical protein
MPKTIHLLLLLFAITPYIAKAQGCEALIKDARTLAKNLKFDEAVKKVEAASILNWIKNNVAIVFFRTFALSKCVLNKPNI